MDTGIEGNFHLPGKKWKKILRSQIATHIFVAK